MKTVLKLYKWLIISVTLQLIFLIYLDTVFLGQKGEFESERLVVQENERLIKDDRLVLPKNSKDIKLSYDFRYISYIVDREPFVMDILKRESVKISDELKSVTDKIDEITEYNWLPDRNLLVLANKKRVSNTTRLEVYSQNFDYKNPKLVAKLSGMPKDSAIKTIEFSPSTKMIYLKIDKQNAPSSIFTIDIMDDTKYILDLKKESTMKELTYTNQMMYEKDSSVYVRNGRNGRQTKIPIEGKTCLLEVDIEDNVYIGIYNSNNEITSIKYASLENAIAKKWNRVDLEKPIKKEDVIVTENGAIYSNIIEDKKLVNLLTFQEIEYKGKMLQITNDLIAYIDGNTLDIKKINE